MLVIVRLPEAKVPVVATFCEPKSGLIFVPAIAALEFIFAFVIVSSAIRALLTAPSANFAVVTASLPNSAADTAPSSMFAPVIV